MATRLLLPRAQRVLVDGRPANGARLYTYVSGTSTPKPVFADAARTVPQANPVVADSAGAFPDMFPEGGTYRVVLEDAAGNVIFTADDVDGIVDAGGGGGSASPALRNRLINGAMQISQQNGTSNVDNTTGAAYTLDQWRAFLSTSPGGTLRVAQVSSLTPGGSPFRLRATVQASDVAIAAGDLYLLEQPLEGLGVADARFGTANARQVILRFGVRCSLSGTFGVSLTNSAKNRSYVTTFSIAPGEINTDVVRTLTIPGDTAGTWLADNGVGVLVRWCLAGGTTFQGTTGWQAGDLVTTSGQINFMGTGSATFELFDAGFYVDEAALGVAPAWEYPEVSRELERCQRYFLRIPAGVLVEGFNNIGGSFSEIYAFPVVMRDTPTGSVSASSSTNVGAGPNANYSASWARFAATTASSSPANFTLNAVNVSARL